MFSVLCSDRGSDLKTAIISIAAGSQELGARDMHKLVVNGYSPAASYQSVHKALNLLHYRNVLEKHHSRYNLSSGWVFKTKEFVSDVEDAYLHKRPVTVLDLPEYGSVKIGMNSPVADPYLWMFRQAKKIKERWKEPLETAIFQRRVWPLIFLTGGQFAEFRGVFGSGQRTMLAGSNKRIDENLCAAWKESGFACKTGVKSIGNCETFVCRDFVFQLFQTKKMERAWDAFYGFMEDDGSASLVAAHETVFGKPQRCECVVSRNKEFAKRLKSQAAEELKGRGE